MDKKSSVYRGVTVWRQNRLWPWRAQISAGTKSYYLGAFAEEADAAHAYDNAAYYLANAGCKRQRTLNFPEKYAGASVPPPTDQTLKVLADFGGEARLGPTAKRLAATTVEALADLLNSWRPKLAAHREAQIAGLAFIDETIRELDERIATLTAVDICPVCRRVCTKTEDNYSDCCEAQMER